MNHNIIITLLVIWILPLSGYPQKNCWKSYRGNPALTGISNAKIPDSLKLLWTFSTDDIIKSSPVSCGNNIFIGSNDGSVYSISKNGKLNWKFETPTSIEAPPIIS